MPLLLLFAAELFQRGLFEPADLRLADADLPRHLHLRFALEVAQLHDPLFARGQGRDGFPGTAGR